MLKLTSGDKNYDPPTFFVELRRGKTKSMKNLFIYLKTLYTKKEVVSRQQVENRRFSEEVRGQLLQLKQKGLSIPIFTL